MSPSLDHSLIRINDTQNQEYLLETLQGWLRETGNYPSNLDTPFHELIWGLAPVGVNKWGYPSNQRGWLSAELTWESQNHVINNELWHYSWNECNSSIVCIVSHHRASIHPYTTKPASGDPLLTLNRTFPTVSWIYSIVLNIQYQCCNPSNQYTLTGPKGWLVVVVFRFVKVWIKGVWISKGLLY